QGTELDLFLLEDPEPYDPDGDVIYWLGFDPSSANNEWMEEVVETYHDYGAGYYRIKMDEVGTHSLQASMRDEFGAVTTRTATVQVIPPNPIPIIDVPPKIVEGRPFIPDFDGSQSYSPTGRDI